MSHTSIVDIVRTVARRININSNFSSVVGSTDPQITNMLYLAETEGQELAARYPWQVLTKQKSFLSVAAQLQGEIDTDDPSAILSDTDNYDYIINDTMWNNDQRIPILGPNTAETWQAREVMGVTGPYPRYRIRANELLFLPEPVDAGDTITFEFYTKNWIYQETGDVYRDTFQDDTDAPLLDARLIILGTVWRWKHARGLEYGQDFDTYERAVADKTARDGPKPIITLDGEPQDTIAPVAIVPTGNWTI
jgi:hypothetical protein